MQEVWGLLPGCVACPCAASADEVLFQCGSPSDLSRRKTAHGSVAAVSSCGPWKACGSARLWLPSDEPQGPDRCGAALCSLNRHRWRGPFWSREKGDS